MGIAKSNRIIILFVTTIILLFAEGSMAQRLTSGGEPKSKELIGFFDAFCVSLPAALRVCKARESGTVEGRPLFLIQRRGRTIHTTDATLSAESTTGNFYAYIGNLDKQGPKELVIADLEGISNGLGISTYRIRIFVPLADEAFDERLSFEIEDFGEKGNLIFDPRRNETLILITYWADSDILDKQRGYGMYLFGKWFRYRNGRLKPAFERPTLARRYLFGFAELRDQTYGDPGVPYKWLRSKNTHRFVVTPKENGVLIDSVRGRIVSYAAGRDEADRISIETDSGTILNYTVGCCPIDSNALTINDIGYLPRKYLYPRGFPSFDLSLIHGELKGKKVKLETFRKEFFQRHVRLWLVN